jgi:hypothetical protein
MRIVISSPPKMGNKWIKCLLGQAYDLTWINGEESPDTNIEEFIRFVEEGRFPDNTIFHQHCKYKPKVVDTIEEIPAHLVTIVRDPYDAFVSMYHWIQSRSNYDKERGRVRRKQRPRDAMVGKSIDDPVILDFLADGYGDQMRRGSEWVLSGRAIVVRYEDLHRNTMAELQRVTGLIEPVDPTRLEQAIEACSVDNMRKMSKRMSMHVRSAKVGESKSTLSEPHLRIFREKHGDLVASLGYEVR